MLKNECCSCWAKIFESLGKFLLGMAAVAGVFKATDVAKIIYQSQKQEQTQKQSQSVNFIFIPPSIAQNEPSKIIEKYGSKSPNQILEKIPEKPVIKGNTLESIFIAPEYRMSAEKELNKAKTSYEKEMVIKDYFEMSAQVK